MIVGLIIFIALVLAIGVVGLVDLWRPRVRRQRVRRPPPTPVEPVAIGIDVVNIGPDDVVIVRVDRPVIAQDQADALVEQFRERGVRAIVIPSSMSLVGVQSVRKIETGPCLAR